VLSGAIKNMFGTMLGLRKSKIHALFPDPSEFARVIVDVHRIARPTISFLDLTTVIEGQGVNDAIRPVGLVLGSTDAVALDTVAAHAIGYEDLIAWTSIYGNAVGLGSNQIDRIIVRGLDWSSFPKRRLRYPELQLPHSELLTHWITRRMNNTVFRPRPVIAAQACTGCGACSNRCPVGAIHPGPQGMFSIDLSTCADCGCCLRVCDVGAVRSEFVGITKVLRRLSVRMRDVTNDGREDHRLD
jgi:ferredoxin